MPGFFVSGQHAGNPSGNVHQQKSPAMPGFFVEAERGEPSLEGGDQRSAALMLATSWLMTGFMTLSNMR